MYLWGKTPTGVIEQPEKVITISSVVEDISLGVSVNVVKDIKGMPWAWGLNRSSELGFGDNEPRDYPFPVSSLINKKVTQVACGGSFTICLGQHISQVPSEVVVAGGRKKKSVNRPKSRGPKDLQPRLPKPKPVPRARDQTHKSTSSI